MTLTKENNVIASYVRRQIVHVDNSTGDINREAAMAFFRIKGYVEFGDEILKTRKK